jgi:hypothetical protein
VGVRAAEDEMSPDHIDKIIAGVFDLLKVALGAAITWLVANAATKRAERRSLRKQLRSRITAILVTTVVNELPGRLKEMKDFFIENPEMLLLSENVQFGERWLTDPFLGIPQTGSWTQENWAQLREDVKTLRIPK